MRLNSDQIEEVIKKPIISIVATLRKDGSAHMTPVWHILYEDFVQMEVKLLQQNISTIENMIGFLQKLPNEHKDETIMKSIIDSMNQLSQKILKMMTGFLYVLLLKLSHKNGFK